MKSNKANRMKKSQSERIALQQNCFSINMKTSAVLFNIVKMSFDLALSIKLVLYYFKSSFQLKCVFCGIIYDYIYRYILQI